MMLRTRKIGALSMCFLAFALLMGTAAVADERMVRDPEDVGGKLDIKKVWHDHSDSGRLRHGLTTFESWRARRLRCRGNLHFVFAAQDRDVRVTFRDGSLRAEIIDTQSGNVIGETRVRRPDSRSVVISLGKGFFGADASAYRWSVHSEWLSACPGDGGDPHSHLDRAPNKGSIRSGV